MDISLQSEQFKQKLITSINIQQLPPVIKYYILKDVFNIIEQQYINYLNSIKQQQDKTE